MCVVATVKSNSTGPSESVVCRLLEPPSSNSLLLSASTIDDEFIDDDAEITSCRILLASEFCCR